MFKDKCNGVLCYAKVFLKWLLLALLIGAIGGVVGTVFSLVLSQVMRLRLENDWLIFLLPIGGVASVGLYKLFKVTGVDTNDVFKSVRTEKKVPYLLAPAIFICTTITHLLGGSAGREGAALQLGGSISSLLGRILRLDEKTRHILTICGMGAFFSALFGTPIGAGIFALEVVSVGYFCSAAFFPTIISSITAFYISTILGVHPERFTISLIPEFSLLTASKTAIIGIACALVSILFCVVMHYSSKLFKKAFSNDFLRIIVGALIIVGLTFLLQTRDYNGGGMEVISGIFENGTVKYEAFILKLLFTAITIGVGFKGGEIVPTLFIGATLGAIIGNLIGFDITLAAAIGMMALLSGVTNCPLATLVLSVELFGGESLLFISVAIVISFLLSGNYSLYTGQRFAFSKLNEEIIEIED